MTGTTHFFEITFLEKYVKAQKTALCRRQLKEYEFVAADMNAI